MRVDSAQWSNENIANSVNNWLDTIAGYAITADRKFQWDDTNHSELPIGTTNLNAGQSDYSFLTDEEGNRILTLLRVERLDGSGTYSEMEYDKIADNVIRLYPTPTQTVAGGLRFYFQRSPSYFNAGDTTKAPGVAPTLHRGFVIASAYDGALALGLQNLQPLSVELQREEAKMRNYFLMRNKDERRKFTPLMQDNR